jgi:S-adenosylmethionine:tRNA ribosyltransferase-isomerase
MIPNIRIEDFNYELPKSRIAQFPLPERDKSNLLVYTPKGEIEHYLFKDLPKLLTKDTLLVRNISRVLPARVYFKKQTGGSVEILLVEPIEPSQDPQITIASRFKCKWKAIVGGKRIHPQSILSFRAEQPRNVEIFAKILERFDEFALIEFTWKPENLNFGQILTILGRTPLPPYIKRPDEPIDRSRYQTIYASHNGSVAAPTAGLHFTREVENALVDKNIEFVDITLHIGPGTFKPVDTNNIAEFIMHSENFSVSKNAILKIYDSISSNSNKTMVAIGTTSVRTIESLYWLACELIRSNIDIKNYCLISQWLPYQTDNEILTPVEALEVLLNQMEKQNIEILTGSTQLLILPGYKIKFFDALLTNFHLPKSTLLMLVYAFVGSNWKRIYSNALEHNYRFLSYGDASLLYRTKVDSK